jgi:hypothetical protein
MRLNRIFRLINGVRQIKRVSNLGESDTPYTMPLR